MLSGLIPGFAFAAPLVLAGLLALPALYLLLRATPPAPRRQVFPALRLLRDLPAGERTPARMPLWLLLLRLLAAALVIIGFAGPEIVPPKLLPGSGPVLIAIDNSWASAPDFPARIQAARRLAAQARQRGVVLLATATDAAGSKPRASGVLTPHAASLQLGALHPEPWPTDWHDAAHAVRAARHRIADLTGVEIGTGLAGPGLHAFRAALDPVRVISSNPADARLLLPPKIDDRGRLLARVAIVPRPTATHVPVLAETRDGGVLARSDVTVKAGRRQGSAAVDLPAPLANRLSRLALAGPDGSGVGAGSVALLDANTRRLTIGLTAGGSGAEQKFLGALYYIRRALPQGTTIRTGRLGTLAAEDPSAIILADKKLGQASRLALHRYVAKGGVLIRFFGPRSAAALRAQATQAPGSETDSLLPDPLLPGVRVIGGALGGNSGSSSAAGGSGTQRIAPFPAHSPLAGLAPPRHFQISRQVLADPSRLDPATVWARLGDGTPLMLGRHLGRGVTVAVLTTANADWSNWPLAGDFPAVIDRLVHLGAGAAPKSGTLHPIRVLNGEGRLVRPGPAAKPLQASALSQVRVSPAHPPGLWGDSHGAAALDLGGHVPTLAAATPPSGVPVGGLNSVPEPVRYGPDLLAAALALLIVDLLASILLRGLIRLPSRRALRGASVLLLASGAVLAGHRDASAAGTGAIPSAALTTELAYVKTGDDRVDSITRAGLTTLSLRVNMETAAHPGAPKAVVPGRDTLALYPLLYWPITGDGTPPDAAGCRAINDFMASGGLLVIDTQGGGASAEGSGAGFHPGAEAALQRATACIDIPPLVRLVPKDTLAHTFFLLHGFPGRFDGAPVEIAANGARDPDGTSPVVIGANDWVGAWAQDESGVPQQALLPGGGDQREMANRFGVNLVMYALTGTYKSDQVQLPTILKRLGQ